MKIFHAEVWLIFALMVLPSISSAQFKWVGPDGKVNYSDHPPIGQSKKLELLNQGKKSAASENMSLPYELKMASQNFPVTLYTGDSCTPCVAARDALKQRGIPFAEKLIKTEADLEVLKKQSGGQTIPSITVGNSKMLGLDKTELNNLLDAAGYPKTSKLPVGWKYPAPDLASQSAP